MTCSHGYEDRYLHYCDRCKYANFEIEIQRLRKVEAAGQELCDFVTADNTGTWDEVEDQAMAYHLVDAWDAAKKGGYDEE